MHIYASRLFAGVASGAAFVVLPIFINEIAESREKAARLTFTIELWRTLGILIGFVLGFYVPYAFVNIVGCAVSFVFTMTFPFVQESPHYYLRKNNMASLEKSLRWYRGIRDIDDREKPEYLSELNEFHAELRSRDKNVGSTPMSHGYIIRLTFVSFLLTVCAKLSGVFVELNYAADFLGRTGYSTETNYVVLASAQCAGALLARLVGPRLPRKVGVQLNHNVVNMIRFMLVEFLHQEHPLHYSPSIHFSFCSSCCASPRSLLRRQSLHWLYSRLTDIFGCWATGRIGICPLSCWPFS